MRAGVLDFTRVVGGQALEHHIEVAAHHQVGNDALVGGRPATALKYW